MQCHFIQSQRQEGKVVKIKFREDQKETKLMCPEMSIQLLSLGWILGEKKRRVTLKNKTLNSSDYEQLFPYYSPLDAPGLIYAGNEVRSHRCRAF